MRLNDVSQLLDFYASVQEEFQALFARKRAALVSGEAEEINRTVEEESTLLGKLQHFARGRDRFLQQFGGGCATLRDYLMLQPRDSAKPLLNRMEELRTRSAELRHEAWVQWIIAQRCHRHYSEVLELIARGGQSANTYSALPNQRSLHTGGAVLDASI